MEQTAAMAKLLTVCSMVLFANCVIVSFVGKFLFAVAVAQ